MSTESEIRTPGDDAALISAADPIRSDPSVTQSLEAGGALPFSFERLYSFRFTYIAILVFIMLYVFTIKGLESYLSSYFYRRADQAITITDFDAPVAAKIQSRIHQMVQQSPWVTIGGVEVNPAVIARDGTWIYVGGYTPLAPPQRLDLTELRRDVERLLPATAIISISVPHNALIANAVLVGYAALLIQILWLRNRSVARREAKLLEAAIAERRDAESRAGSIESELESMRLELLNLEPSDPTSIDEVAALRNERRTLEGKLASLESREQELRGRAAKAGELGNEIKALEDLLEEASDDLQEKDEAIHSLEKRLKRVARDADADRSSRVRESEQLGRRYSTLYKNLEVDGRAIHDIVALRDEGSKLKCEEKLKRLNDEADNLSVRRKVGGLPSHLTIFEMGFGSKGRLYYMRGKQRRFRILNVGAKNTQNAALDYLRKL